MKLAKVVSGLGLALVAFSAQATSVPGWERPILSAQMKVTQARMAFEKAKDVSLVLTKQDGKVDPTGLTLSFQVGETKRVVRLVIESVTRDDCGTTQYRAQLPKEVGSEATIGRRFSVVLEDHSTRTCEDYKPFLWEANVREGFGWCGTMDATMSIVGNPEPVYTIQ